MWERFACWKALLFVALIPWQKYSKAEIFCPCPIFLVYSYWLDVELRNWNLVPSLHFQLMPSMLGGNNLLFSSYVHASPWFRSKEFGFQKFLFWFPLFPFNQYRQCLVRNTQFFSFYNHSSPSLRFTQNEWKWKVLFTVFSSAFFSQCRQCLEVMTRRKTTRHQRHQRLRQRGSSRWWQSKMFDFFQSFDIFL